MNIDVSRQLNYNFRWDKEQIDKFLNAKGPGVTLRTYSNSNYSKYRIIAKWVGDTVVSKNDPSYADVIEALEEGCKSKGIYICKVEKKFLTKSDLEIGKMLGEMGLW